MIATKPLPAPHHTLFCHTSLPDPLCPLHFPIRVLLKGEITHYWSYALLQASRDYLFYVSLSQLQVQLLQFLNDPNWSHSTVLAPGDRQGTKFPRCQAVWLAAFLWVIFPIRGFIMCWLWRQICHFCDSSDIRDLPGLHLVRASELFTLPSPAMGLAPLNGGLSSFLTMFFLYKRWKQKTLKIIAGHCVMCEISSGSGEDWKDTF